MRKTKHKPTTKSGKKRAKHYEPKLKIYGSFSAAVKALVAEPKAGYKKAK